MQPEPSPINRDLDRQKPAAARLYDPVCGQCAMLSSLRRQRQWREARWIVCDGWPPLCC